MAFRHATISLGAKCVPGVGDTERVGAAVTSADMAYTSWEEVPDRLLATEAPPLNDVDRIWREDRARIRCRSCSRHYIARVSDTPDCADCRSGKPPRPMPDEDRSGDQTVSRAR